MKKKILLTVFAMLTLAAGVFAYAFTAGGISFTPAASCCCCSGDSCPLKKKSASEKDTASCCDCCKGDSCPMKMEGASAVTSPDTEKAAAASDKKSCDCDCCKDEKEKKTTSAV